MEITTPSAPLAQEQRDFFCVNGYVSLGKILDDDLIELLRSEFDAEFERAARLGSSYNYETKAKDGEPARVMVQIQAMFERNIHFHKLLYDARILDKIEPLIGPNIQLWHDQALWKPAHHGGQVAWHQDNAYWKAAPANLVSCWLTLDDVKIENGAMQFIPGSHLKPIWHDESNGLLSIESEIDTTKAVAVELPAGGALIHHCQTLHYTQPNSTPNQRRAYAMHYCTPGTSLFSDTVKVGWEHPLLRARI